MTYIPDCRNDENYNEKYLNEKDAEFVKGYDWCAEEVADNFFNNINVYFEDDSHLMHILNEEMPESMQYEEDVEYRFGQREKETRKVKTYLDMLRSKLQDWIESERDELIVSMIDNMDDEEYKKNKRKANGK